MMATILEQPGEIMKLLLDHGADPHKLNNQGESALDLARADGKELAVEFLQSAESSRRVDDEAL